MNVVITDPVNEDITREEGEFKAKWAELGELFLSRMMHGANGDKNNWINISLCENEDSYAMHRTVAL